MSPKELLYVEDALGHTHQIKTVCDDLSQQIADQELKNFVADISRRQQQSFDRFYGLL